MSHHSNFYLTVLELNDIPNHFGTAIAKQLLGEYTVTDTQGIAKKRIYGYTRSDWFKWKIAQVLKQTPYHDLMFLSEEVCSHLILTNEDAEIIHEHELIEFDEDDYERDAFTLNYYTVIPAHKVGDILTQVNSLLTWCANNIEIIADILEWSHEDILNAMNTMQAYDCVNDCPNDDEGNTESFFFCALASIQAMLSHAQANGLYAIYKNENFDVGLDWFLAHKPQMISFA